MKLLKKTISLLMASVMCMPTAAMSVMPVAAAQTEISSGTSDTGRVTLSESENGSVKFSGTDADTHNFTAGDRVTLNATPDKGFQVKDYAVYDASGKKIASRETDSRSFTFTAPSASVTASAEFEAVTAENASASVRKEEKKAMSDDSSESATKYISDALDDSAVEKTEKESEKASSDADKPSGAVIDKENTKNGLVPTIHQLDVQYLYADSRYVNKDTTIDDVWNVKDSSKSIITNIASPAQLYSVKGNDNVYVAFTDAAKMNGVSKATYADFTDGNNSNPTVYNDKITFDKDTGVVYVPRSLYLDKDGKEKTKRIVAQMLVPYSIEKADGMNGINVTVDNKTSEIKEAARQQTILGNTFDVTTTVPVTTKDTAKYFSPEDTEIYLNGSTIPAAFTDKEIYFDEETGKLTFKGCPASIYSIRIVLKKAKKLSIAERLTSVFARRTFAKIGTAADMLTLKSVTLSTNHQLTTKDIGATFKFNTVGYYDYGGDSWPNAVEKDRNNFFYYCYYMMTDAAGGRLNDIIESTTKDLDHDDWVELLQKGIVSVSKSNTGYARTLYDFAFKLPKDIGELKDVSNSGSGLTMDFGDNSDWPMDYVPLHCAHTRVGSKKLDGNNTKVSAKILNVYTEGKATYAVIGFAMNVDAGGQQSQGMYKIRIEQSEKPGYVAVEKKSGNTALCNGSSYTVDGAIYRVYESKEDANNTEGSITSITVSGSSGTAKGVSSDKAAKRLEEGKTYYIRESQNTKHAPAGHKIDPKVYTVTAAATAADAQKKASPALAESTEEEIYDPIKALVRKVDGTTALSGAQYTITRNDGAVNEKWVIQTGSDGIAILDSDHVVPNSGSSAIYASGLPMGSYTIQETKAPDGYSTEGSTFVTPNGTTYTPADAKVSFTIKQVENEAKAYESNGKEIQSTIAGVGTFYQQNELQAKGRFYTNKIDHDSKTAEPQGNAPDLTWKGQVTANQDNTWVDLNNNNVKDAGELFSSGQVVWTFTTDDKGSYQEPDNIFGVGSYTVTETQAPTGYDISSQQLGFTIANNDENKYAGDTPMDEPIWRGTMKIDKIDAEKKSYANPQGDGSLQGAQYRLYNRSSHYVYVRGQRYEPNTEISVLNGSLVTDKEGRIDLSGETDLLPYGSYHLAEVAPSIGYLKENLRGGAKTEFDFTIHSKGEAINFGYTIDPSLEEIKRGNVEIQKVNADVHNASNANKAQGDSTFEGAVYNLYNRSKNSIRYGYNGPEIPVDGLITTLTTDKNGFASTPALSLPYGTYEVVEATPSVGYLSADIRNGVTKRTFKINDENVTEKLTWTPTDTEKALYEPAPRGQIRIKKNNADVQSDDPDAAKAQGDSTFKGATFDIINRSDSYVWVDKNHNGQMDGNECFEPGQVVCTLTTDENGYAATPEKYLPYGTYDVVETKAPEGYLLTKNGFRGAITEQDGITIREEGQVQNFEYKNEKQAQGDYSHTFYDAAPRGTFKFKKRDLETKKNKPLGGAKLDGTYQLINRSKSYVWINLDGSKDSKGNPTYDKSEKFAPGAVIFKFITDRHTGYFDTYTDLKDEEKVMRADGTALDKSKLGKILLPYGTYEIYEETAPTGYLHTPKEKISVKFSIRNKDASGRTLTDKDAPEIADMTDDIYHKDEKAKDQSSAKTQNAAYNYVKRGDIYFDKRSFNARTNDDDVDNDTSSAKKESYIPFRITSLDQDGKAVESHIVFTDANGIYDSRSSYAKHTYKTNAGDSGYNAKTKTVTDDDNSKGHVGTWFGTDQGAPVKDSISDRTDENGKVYNQLGAFPYGRYKIDELPCAKNKGVNLYHGSFTVSHESSTNITEYSDPADWANGGQLHDNPDLGTIYNRYITISTEALEREHSSHSAVVTDDVDIIDRAEINNLLQNEKYRLTATLVYSDSGETVKDADGTELKFVKNFTAKNEFSEVKVPINIDAESLGVAGKTVTVYEKLERIMKDGKAEEVASEEDALDEEQQIRFPGASTTALAGNGQQLEEAKKDVTINDKVAYRGFEAGRKYRIETLLADKATGNYITVGGDKVAATTTFKPEKSEGTQDVKINFDATGLEGKTLVVFEKIYRGDTLYAQHADISDEGQTVFFPAVHTTAKDKETDEHLGSQNGTQITDDVAYSNVIAGKEYTIKGRLVSKSDPTKVIAEAETKFTAPGTEGTVTLTFDVKLSEHDGETLVAYEDLYLGDAVIGRHENPDDEGQSIHKPSVKTTAVDKTTGDHVAARSEKTVFTDTVAYSNVIVGKEYTVKGELFNKETGKSMDVRAEKTFTAEKTEGTIDLEFEVDSAKLAGTTVVVEEHMYYKGIEVGAHADLNDEAQSVHIPDIHTTATDKASGDKNTRYGKDTVVTDTVAYTNLVPGKEYTVKGELYSKDTGKSIGVTAEKTFTPEKSEGTVDIEFTVDTTQLQGQTLVAFETMQYKGTDIAVHADISDAPQTVYVPEIHTTAISQTTGTKSTASSRTEKIRDTVAYKNLIVGKTYTLSGELYDKATGQSIGVKAQTTFAPDRTEGTVDLEFTVDTTQLVGKTLVAFEDVQLNGVSVGVHADINDVAQSVYVPEIHTTAADKSTKTKTAAYGKKTVITDTVAYRNLTAGKQYTVRGELYSRKTGQPVGAKAEKTFTAESADGTVDLEFTVDTSKLEGQTVVAFENLYQDSILLAVHADIKDENQSVYVPSLKTTAKDKATGTKTVSYGKKTVITDTVAYSNLTTGKKYTVKGELYFCETGKSAGAKAEKTFTAKKANGTVELKFTVDTTRLGGKTLVAFENLYMNKVQVGAHANLKDKAQTVYVPSLHTTAKVNGSKTAEASSEMTITDRVYFRNLVKGQKYTVTGTLHDKATGKALSISGRKITKSVTFTAKAANGYTDVKFTFDGSACGGRSIVVFEDLYLKGKLVGQHADISDISQTVRVTKPVVPPVKKTPKKHIKSKKTGDATVIVPYVLAALAAIAAVILVITGRKKKK